MKEISEMTFPEELKYAKDHEWVRPGEGTVTIGISDYAQEQLGDIVFIELPDVGAAFSAGDEFGTVESVKAASELYMPIDGQVVKVNSALEESPELVNTSPYNDGWMLQVRATDPAQLDSLLTRQAYMDLLTDLE